MLSGYVCLWRYGKRKFNYIKNKANSPVKNPIHLTRGDNIYIPISVSRKDRLEGELERSVNSILKKYEKIKSIAWHDTDNEFHYINVGR